jgi:hypothetical protein
MIPALGKGKGLLPIMKRWERIAEKGLESNRTVNDVLSA